MNLMAFLSPIFFLLILLWLWVERGHLMFRSTWVALKWLGLKRTITGGLHGVWYGRHIVSYLNFVRKMAYRFGSPGKYASWMENTYHGKVLTPELAKSIVTIKEDIPRQDLGTKVIPYTRARDIVLNASPDIVITQCGCKELQHEKGNPCKKVPPPYMTCMLIGKPLTDFLLDHKPDLSRRITTDEALSLLEGFHEAGLVHTAWFKDCIKDQFYVICNCCSCCCLGFEMMKLGIKQQVSSGYVAKVDEDACRGCETALEWCPFDAIQIIDNKSSTIWDKCMGCGVCVSKCPNNARSLELEERKGLPMDIMKLTGPDMQGSKVA